MNAVDKIRAELASITHGQWHFYVEDGLYPAVEVPGVCTVVSINEPILSEPDAILIAHAPAYLTALCDLANALIAEWSRSDDTFDTVGAKLYVTADMIMALATLDVVVK